jgi:hypothetical protein
MFTSLRLRASALVAVGAMTATFGPALVSAEAVTPEVRAATSIAESPRLVLSSPFGDARSRVTGSFGRAGTVRGWFTPRKFVNRGGQLKAVGRLHAVLIRANGSVRDQVDQRIVIPVRRFEGTSPAGRAARAPSCQVLNLVLGPLDLNLLGLEVHLNRVVLNIEATPGPGNLLGNLLCAVAGLLDNTGVLPEVRRILNSILGLLRL